MRAKPKRKTTRPGKPKGRNHQVLRLMCVQRLLQRPGGASLAELVDELKEEDGPGGAHVCVRTLRRDIDALKANGIPVVGAQGEAGRPFRYHIAAIDSRKQLGLPIEFVDLRQIVASMGASASGTADPTQRVMLKGLLAKLSKALTSREIRRLEALREVFHDPWRGLSDQEAQPWLGQLADAAIEHKLCDVAYEPYGRAATQHRILPLRLFTSDGFAYVLAYHPRREHLITFALRRIRGLTITEQAELPPRHVEPDAFLGSLFRADGGGELVTYHLRFDAIVAQHIREIRVHPTQRIAEAAGGCVTLSFTCQGSVQVSGWVASWRDHVEVVEPQALREELAELGRYFAERYDTGSDGG